MAKDYVKNAWFNEKTLKKQPVDFRISAIIVDGMWWTFDQWQEQSHATTEELSKWINGALEDGRLIQAKGGAKSYRMPLESIKQWYKDCGREFGSQVLSFLFAPRIWDGMTEVEGFESAPLREIATVSFSCPQPTAKKITSELRGVARVRELTPGHYRAHGLSSDYIVSIIKDVYTSLPPSERGVAHPRSYAKRREIIDFSPNFADGLVDFYQKFSNTLLASQMDTIKIFLPDPFDRESQIVDWVLSAIEKYDEKSSVPFSGYLNTVLKHWPFDLPNVFLGKELSNFQRARSKAIKKLTGKNENLQLFSSSEIAEEMNISQEEFDHLEDEHRAWIGIKNATTLSWDESTSEEKASARIGEDQHGLDSSSARTLSNKLSLALLSAGISSGDYANALRLIENIDTDSIDMNVVQKISDSFKGALLESLTNNGVKI